MCAEMIKVFLCFGGLVRLSLIATYFDTSKADGGLKELGALGPSAPSKSSTLGVSY